MVATFDAEVPIGHEAVGKADRMFEFQLFFFFLAGVEFALLGLES